jgi:hypothetical protein
MHRSQINTISTPQVRFRWLTLNLVIAAWSLAVATLVMAPPAFAKDKGNDEGALGPGCAPERPAIAHHAGGVVVESPRGKAHTPPIPCTSSTGFRTAEISLVVTNDGTLLFQPAFDTTGAPIGLLRSVNQGENWDFVNPTVTPPRIPGVDMNLWVDRDTGRAFWSSDGVGLMAFGIPSRDENVYIDHSDDDGKTWVRSSPLPMFYDHTQIFSGPPTIGLKHLMQRYPNVIYVAVSGGFTCFVFNFCGTQVAKSLDGAVTFGQPVAVPYPPECPSPGTNPTGGYGLNGVVSRDGTVYLPFTPCERPYVAISHDEGSTWQLSLVADTETIGWGELGLGVDKEGNLYATWTAAADRLPYLAISRDRALHWSAPLMIAAPGVNEAAEPQLVAGARGQVAISYYGSKNSPGVPFPPPCTDASVSCPGYESETWDTYITETFNALARQPLFWSATLNDPTQPTWYGLTPSSLRVPNGFAGGSSAGTQGGPSLGGRMDYYGMTIAPDDTPWVAFAQECPFGLPIGGNPNCSQAAGGPNDGLFGLVGRLVRVHGEADEDNDH